MNDLVVDWCRAKRLEVTRSRAYRKNDQAWVEKKNGAIVRRLVGYGRFEGMLAAESLSRLYAAARSHGNLFQPSFKLKKKRREGARVIKTYHPPQPPVTRVLADASILETDKTRQLRTVQRFIKLRRSTMAREVSLGPMPRPEALGMMATGEANFDRPRQRDARKQCVVTQIGDKFFVSPDTKQGGDCAIGRTQTLQAGERTVVTADPDSGVAETHNTELASEDDPLIRPTALA